MANAAARPWAMASMATAGPVVASPPAKTPGIEVAKDALSTTIAFWRVVERPLSLSMRPRSMSCPMAEMAKSHGRSYSEPLTGTGLLRPLASGSPSSMRMHRSASSLPSFATMETGAERKTHLDAFFCRGIHLHLVGRHLVHGPPVEDDHLPGADPREVRAASTAVLPPPTTTTVPYIRRRPPSASGGGNRRRR